MKNNILSTIKEFDLNLVIEKIKITSTNLKN